MFGLFNKSKASTRPRSRPRRPRQAMSYHGYYEGVTPTAHRAQFPNIVGDSDLTMSSWTRKELISTARKLYENDGIVKGAVNKLAKGSFPLTPQAATSNREWNTAAEEYFNTWAKTRADITGAWSFNRLQRKASKAVYNDGDILAVFTNHLDGTPALQLVESHRIDSSGLKNPNNVWLEGVKHNALSRPTAYAVRTKKNTTRVVSAANAMLLMDPDRVGQRRGLPAVSFALAHIKDKREILGYEKLTVKYLASCMPYIYSPDGELDEDNFGITERDNLTGDEEETETEEDTSPSPIELARRFIQRVWGGEIGVLPEGYKIDTINNDRDSASFTGFLEFLLREIAIGLDIPFEFLINPQGITGPAQRAILDQVMAAFEDQREVFDNFIRRVYVYVISHGISTGELAPQKDWYKVTLQSPAKLTIDGGKEAQQKREDVRSGLRSRRKHFSELGEDWESEMTQIYQENSKLFALAQQLSKETGQPLNLCLDRLSILTPNGTLTNGGSNKSTDDDEEEEDDE